MTTLADTKTFVQETQAARAALEAKGAFTGANAATHIIKALEALSRLLGTDETVRLAEKFAKQLGR